MGDGGGGGGRDGGGGSDEVLLVLRSGDDLIFVPSRPPVLQFSTDDAFPVHFPVFSRVTGSLNSTAILKTPKRKKISKQVAQNGIPGRDLLLIASRK